MSSTSFLISAVISVLGFLASPTGGRDIGRGILRNIGLRGSGKRK
ncbi:MAG: hypothetical protein ABJN98_01505 [Roseibium sp.]